MPAPFPKRNLPDVAIPWAKDLERRLLAVEKSTGANQQAGVRAGKNSVSATSLASDATLGAATAQTQANVATVDAATAQVSASSALLADGNSINPSFGDWTGTYPNGYALWAASPAPVKELTILRTAPAAARFTVTTAGTQTGMTILGTLLPSMAYSEYVTMTLDFYLVSGTLNGTGVLFDWSGFTGTVRVTTSLLTEFPSAVAGRWYRLTKVLKKPTTTGGSLSSFTGFLMANYASHAGGNAVKDIIFDRLTFRASTVEEVTAITAMAQATTATTNAATADGKAVAADAKAVTADGKAVAAQGTADTAVTNAATAQGAADTAIASANGKSKITYSDVDPVAAGMIGDTWFKRGTDARITGIWEWAVIAPDPAAWVYRTIDDQVIGNLDAGKITSGYIDADRIDANTITASMLTADAINGKTITGATILTAATWPQVVIGGSGITVVNAAGEDTITLGGPDGALSAGDLDLSGDLLSSGKADFSVSIETLGIVTAGDYLQIGPGPVPGATVRAQLQKAGLRFYTGTDPFGAVSGGIGWNAGAKQMSMASGTGNSTITTNMTGLDGLPADLRVSGTAGGAGAGGNSSISAGTIRASESVRTNSYTNSSGGKSAPFAIAAGLTPSNQDVPFGGAINVAVTFPAGRFTVPPIVVANSTLAKLIAVANTVTTSGCNVRLDSAALSGTSTDPFVTWTAIQMTSTTAAG